jgi:hypothetical protein
MRLQVIQNACDLDFIQASGFFLSVAGHEREGGTLGKQIFYGHDLVFLDAKALGDDFMDAFHGVFLVMGWMGRGKKQP